MKKFFFTLLPDIKTERWDITFIFWFWETILYKDTDRKIIREFITIKIDIFVPKRYYFPLSIIKENIFKLLHRTTFKNYNKIFENFK
jgi:hypothetical protein